MSSRTPRWRPRRATKSSRSCGARSSSSSRSTKRQKKKKGGKVKTRDIVIFTRQFSTMINSGLPLVQALDILSRQSENKALQDVTHQVVYDVESGHTVADALRQHPKAFTDLYVNMVAAGEAGGILDTILMRLATFLEKNDALVGKVKGAMIYPAVIMSVAFIAIVTLLIFVIPVFENMFASRESGAAAADAHRDHAVELPQALLVGSRRAVHGSRSCSLKQLLQDVERPAQHRQDPAQGARARRHAPQVGRVALHAHAGHADLRPACQHSRWARDHGEDGRQSRHSRCDHGVAREHRGWRHDLGAAAEVERVPADGDLDDRGRRADGWSGRDADEDRRLLRHRGRHGGERASEL